VLLIITDHKPNSSCSDKPTDNIERVIPRDHHYWEAGVQISANYAKDAGIPETRRHSVFVDVELWGGVLNPEHFWQLIYGIYKCRLPGGRKHCLNLLRLHPGRRQCPASRKKRGHEFSQLGRTATTSQAPSKRAVVASPNGGVSTSKELSILLRKRSAFDKQPIAE